MHQDWYSVLSELLFLRAMELEVRDEAETCGEAVGARVQRRDEHRVENGCFAPPGLPQAVYICLFHLPWTAGQLVGKAEQFHDFGLNRRAGIVQRQFAFDGLVQAKPAEDFQVGRQTVGRDIQSARHDGELFFYHPGQPAVVEHGIGVEIRLVLQQLGIVAQGAEIVGHETPSLVYVVVDTLHLRTGLLIRNERDPRHT